MQIKSLDHVNLRTYRLQEMVTWYDEVLGMPAGERPAFSTPGAWIYAGDNPVVHLVEIEPEDPSDAKPKIEHFALAATGLPDMVERLSARGIAHELTPVPGLPIVQLHVHDPDGNHIHIDFSDSEMQ